MSTSVAHITQAIAGEDGGCLAGLMFSGCTDDAGAGSSDAAGAYGAWSDTHMPSAVTVPGSLLTEEAVKLAFGALKDGCRDSLTYCGVKLTCLHDASREDVALRLQTNSDLLALLQACDPQCQ